MQPIISSSPVWSQVSDAKPKQFHRIKNGIETKYTQEKFLGSGNTSVVYAIVPLNQRGRSKVIKIATTGEFSKEYELLKKINASGKQVGIANAPKDLIGKKIMIMSRYTTNLECLIKANEYTDQEIIEGLKQIFEGIVYLKNNDFYHGDIVSSNVFIKKERGALSFHLGDFGHGEDLSKLTTEQQLICRLAKLQMLHCILPTALSELSAKPIHERVSFAKSLFYITEAFAFGLLMRDISCELRSDSKIKERLASIGKDVMESKSFEGIENSLEQLSVNDT